MTKIWHTYCADSLPRSNHNYKIFSRKQILEIKMFNDYRVDVKYIIIIINENFLRDCHTQQVYADEYIGYMSGNVINSRLQHLARAKCAVPELSVHKLAASSICLGACQKHMDSVPVSDSMNTYLYCQELYVIPMNINFGSSCKCTLAVHWKKYSIKPGGQRPLGDPLECSRNSKMGCKENNQ